MISPPRRTLTAVQKSRLAIVPIVPSVFWAFTCVDLLVFGAPRFLWLVSAGGALGSVLVLTCASVWAMEDGVPRAYQRALNIAVGYAITPLLGMLFLPMVR